MPTLANGFRNWRFSWLRSRWSRGFSWGVNRTRSQSGNRIQQRTPPLIAGALMDIVLWLRSLGLGKYEAAFRENDIDETVLPSLTHETLKERHSSRASAEAARRNRCSA
jgi:SAM domain (Sterile alpha motif)